jgi:hypothetical protein
MSERKLEPPQEDGAEQPFLQRWSRLKSAARAGETAVPEPVAEPVTEPAVDSSGADARPALPDLELLDQDSDYSAFLAPEVDPLLKRLALRKLFRSPKFNVCDGLDDYCDDFTRFTPLGSTVTADMRHQLERAARQALAAVEQSTTTTTTATVAGQPDPSRGGPTVAAADPPVDDQPPDEKRADDADADPA